MKKYRFLIGRRFWPFKHIFWREVSREKFSVEIRPIFSSSTLLEDVYAVIGHGKFTHEFKGRFYRIEVL